MRLLAILGTKFSPFVCMLIFMKVINFMQDEHEKRFNLPPAGVFPNYLP